MTCRELEQEIVRLRRFHYVRVGYDRRVLELLPGNWIGGGKARLERTWHVREEGGESVLLIAGDDGITCKLTRGGDHCWRGRWLVYERMPIELIPEQTQPLPSEDDGGAEHEPIDAVYLWVDGADPAWQESLQQRVVECGAAADAYSLASRHFRDNQELKYSLRSLEQHAPWIRQIHLVTNGQAPHWLNPAHPRLAIVPHDTIFPDLRHLPSFNSHAIELHLHRIPGLSRRFIYFNDDVFLGRPVMSADFLTADGIQTVYVEDWTLPTNPNSGMAHDRAYAYTQTLLNQAVDPKPRRVAVAHAPQMYDAELMARVQHRWRQQIMETSSHAFRNPRDVALRILYLHYALESGENAPHHRAAMIRSGSADYAFVMLQRAIPRVMASFDEIRFQRPKFICVNDDLDESEEVDIVLHQCRRFLEQYFPRPSSFERTKSSGPS